MFTPGYTSYIGTIQALALENPSSSHQALGAKGYFLIPDPQVEYLDNDLVRVSVGDKIACISSQQQVRPVVHQLTMEWLQTHTPG